MILGPDGKPYAGKYTKAPKVNARYDAQRSSKNAEYSRYYADADYLSPNASVSYAVRRAVRSNARFEVENSSLAKGMLLTLSHDMVGTQPQLAVESGTRERDREIEKAFNHWASRINLGAKLRTMRMSKCTDGEIFAVFTNNPKLGGQVQLDLQLVEADLVTDPTYHSSVDERKEVDGVVLDRWGNPSKYKILKEHPGASFGLYNEALKYDIWDSSEVIHWYREDRPGQKRGICEFVSALLMFGDLRRYIAATVAAAETAADFAAILYSDFPSDETQADIDPLDSFQIEKRMMTTMPYGWKPAQMKAEQPTTTFSEFRKSMVNEIARCLNMPLNIAAADSSEYNYASGRLDHQVYDRSISVERHHCEQVVLNRVFYQWADEASLSTNLFAGSGPIADLNLQWIWPARPHSDPAKEADAAIALVDAKLLSRERYIRTSLGVDPDTHYLELQRDQERAEEYGVEENEQPVDEGAAETEEEGEESPEPTPAAD